MSLVQLSNVCSHLQNASLARLGLTSIPHSRMHLLLAVQLQKQGFISNVVLGGSSPPQKLLPKTALDRDLKFNQPGTIEPKEDGYSRQLSKGMPHSPVMRHAFDFHTAFQQTNTASAGTDQAEHVQMLAEGSEEDDTFPINELFPASNLDNVSKDLLVKEAFTTGEGVTQVNRASRRLWLTLKYWDGEPVMRKLKMLSRPTQKLWLSHNDLGRIVRGKRANYVDGMTRIGECIFLSTDKGIMEARECVERRIGGLVLCRVWG